MTLFETTHRDHGASGSTGEILIKQILNYVLFTVLLVTWLFPVAYRGLAGKNFYQNCPRSIRHLHNVSCLFTHEVKSWQMYYLEARPVGGKWIEVDDEIYSPMRAFGYRTRMDFLLTSVISYSRGRYQKRQYREMAAWMRESWRLHNDGEELAEFRVVLTRILTGEEALGDGGHWVKPKLETFPKRKRTILFTKKFETED